jgi:hypothetical protein
MQNNVARKLETLERQNLSTTSAQEIFHHPSAWGKEEGVKKRTLTRERIEEVVGVIFVVAVFFLSGWFYYSLYQALQGSKVF